MSGDLHFRTATTADLPAIVAMLADDMLGAERERVEDPLPRSYYEAFERMAVQVGNEIHLAVLGDEVVGCAQLVLIPGLSHQGATRLEIEMVRVAGSHRGSGIGQQLIRHAIELARQQGVRMIQLTTNKARHDAQRFYERLGFTASHVGMKLMLEGPS